MQETHPNPSQVGSDLVCMGQVAVYTYLSNA
ncbi:hypothetical protein FHS90_004325 [Rufibacter quisquiliarum]|uniref:Uncharacterized protein n=1 Tax=Rufibacter quisquiliarum TaxID=1549639 RepID=A0A839GXM4_9BACT|nr:hypothetical protein [Rufibacter quisquiliarum]